MNLGRTAATTLIAALSAGGVLLASGTALAQDRTGRAPEPVPGLANMEQHMSAANPGMARMHQLHSAGNPGMARMHQLMTDGPR